MLFTPGQLAVMRLQLLKSRLLLIFAGLFLGYLARLALGPPASETDDTNRFIRPLPEASEVSTEPDDLPEIPLERQGNADGLVPPIRLPGQRPLLHVESTNQVTGLISNPAFDHDQSAEFEPHGELLCASGCAASRHPTEELKLPYFEQLLREFANQPLNENSPALEELLFYGPQTKSHIVSTGFGPLDKKRADLLWEQLKFSHARVSIRVVDEQGEVRTWLEKSRVPFDRRHVFEMETQNLQPLVTSGTVKRVGLNHLWVRL